MRILHIYSKKPEDVYCVIFDFDETDDFFSIEKENSDGTFSDFNSVDEVLDQQKVVLRGYETIKMKRI